MRKAILVEGMSRGGPYSHAVSSDSRVFVSGQTGLNAQNKEDFASQFDLALDNITRILADTGRTVKDISKLIVYIKRKEDFSMVNKLFEKHFNFDPPARTTIVCGFVNDDVLVELDATV